MKRSGFVPKSTWKPLRRSPMPVRAVDLPDRRNAPPRKRINPVSKRRQRVNREYRTMRSAYLAAHRRCEVELVGCTQRSTELHHVLSRGRSGRDSDLVDPDNVLAACRACHDWIESNRREAVELGLLRHGFQKVGER